MKSCGEIKYVISPLAHLQKTSQHQTREGGDLMLEFRPLKLDNALIL